MGAWELSDMFHLKAIEIIACSPAPRSPTKPKAARIWRSVQYVAGMGFSNVGLGIVIRWRTRSARCTTRPTAWPTPFFCPPSWRIMPRRPARSIAASVKAMACLARENMTAEQYRSIAVDAVRSPAMASFPGGPQA